MYMEQVYKQTNSSGIYKAIYNDGSYTLLFWKTAVHYVFMTPGSHVYKYSIQTSKYVIWNVILHMSFVGQIIRFYRNMRNTYHETVITIMLQGKSLKVKL